MWGEEKRLNNIHTHIKTSNHFKQFCFISSLNILKRRITEWEEEEEEKKQMAVGVGWGCKRILTIVCCCYSGHVITAGVFIVVAIVAVAINYCSCNCCYCSVSPIQ